MKAYSIAGYGDAVGYMKMTSKMWFWGMQHDLQTEFIKPGWEGDPESFGPKFRVIEDKLLKEPSKVGIVAVSAGVSVALALKQMHPEKVGRVVGICGPVHKDKMDQEKLHRDYGLLVPSLDQLSLEGLPKEEVKLYYSLGDDVVSEAAAMIEGVQSKVVDVQGHAKSIAYIAFRYGGEIAGFISQQEAVHEHV